MAYRENIDSTVLVCLGLFALAASLCHCTSLTRLNTPDKPRDNSRLEKSQAKGSHHRHGRLLIGQYALPNVQLNGTKATQHIQHADTDYQADMGWIETKHPSGQGTMSKLSNAAVERLLKMQPNIECTGDSMKLQVEDAASTPGSLLFVDRGSGLSPIPLSKLPSSCGYSIRSTRKDLVLVAPYDGCFVSLEEDCYVLPLRWCGIPVRMSCPVKGQPSPNPPMVTCYAEGMVVKIESTISASNIKVNLNGNWEPLMKASRRCGFTIIEQSESVVISAGYGPCLEEKDGMYIFELAGDGETKISCPSLQPVHPESIQNPSNVGQGENGAPKPGATWGQVYQPFHPDNFYHQPKPEIPRATKPTAAPWSPQPEVLQGRVDQPFYSYPFYRQPTPEIPTATQPTDAPQPQKPGAPWGQVQQPFYPLYTQPKPEIPQVTKPTVASQPRLPYPFYSQPQPAFPSGPKPIAAPQPQKPEVSQGQVQQPFHPHSFYSQPQPEVLVATKPTSTPQLPTREMPQGHVQQPFCFYPYYPQQRPEIPPTKPTATPQPQNLGDPLGQVQQPFCIYPSYPQPEPNGKPTAAPWPPQPEVLQGHVDQPFYSYPFYHQPTPEIPTATQPTDAPQPQKPGAHWGQVQQPFYPFYFQPNPEIPQVAKPTVASQPLMPGLPYPLYPQPQPAVPSGAKPIAIPQPQKPEVPQGQVWQPFNPHSFYPQPKPEVLAATKPTSTPQLPKSEMPQGQPFCFYPHYPQQQPELPPTTKPIVTQLPKSEMPQGQPFCFYPHYPPQQPEIPPTTKPIATPQPQNPGETQGQVQQPFCIYPSYPQTISDTKLTPAPRLPQPEVLQGQVDQPFYSYPFYRQPTPVIPTYSRFTADPLPQKPGVPQGQEQQPSYPYNLQPQPKPEIPPATKPSAAHQPLIPPGHTQPPFSPYSFYPRPKLVVPQGQAQPFYSQPTAKPTAAPLPPMPEAPHGLIQQLFYPSKIPGAETTEHKSPMEKPPAISHHPFHQPVNPFYFSQQPQHVTLPPATTVQQQVITQATDIKATESGASQLSIPHVPSMYCPQVCPSGFSNCCIQMAFHQHVHHVIPFDSKGAHRFYPGLPISHPPDGNLAALPRSNPSETAHPQPPVSPFPYSSHWLYPPQNKKNVQQNHSPVPINSPPEPPAPGYEPISQELYNLHSTTQGTDQQSAGNTNNEQNVPGTKESNFFNKKSTESISDFLVPYYMLQDAPVPTYNYSEPQPFVSGSKNSQHEKTLTSHSVPTGYVLLHHGPPGREANTIGDSHMSFGDVAHNSQSVAQNPARLHSSKSQIRVKLPQEKSPSSELKSHALPGHVDDIQRLDVESDVPWLSPALHGPHSKSHEYFSAADLKPEFPESFKDLWKSLKPLGYSQRHRPTVPGKVFQRVRSASDHQTNGSKQPPHIEPGS